MHSFLLLKSLLLQDNNEMLEEKIIRKLVNYLWEFLGKIYVLLW